MSPYLAEFVGTAILILLGNGVVANVVLARSKGNGGGWIVITAGWGMAVAVAVYAVGRYSGAHINPAVTVGLATIGSIKWSLVPGYIVAQILGAFAGAILVWLSYLPHWPVTEDGEGMMACFCTSPAVRIPWQNAITEFIGTVMLVVGVLAISSSHPSAPQIDPLLVGLLVFAIGLSLGGPTGYAINPARDLGPRIAHQLLPLPGKVSSDWDYAWVPVVAPLVGGVVGALLYRALWI
jgi:glycerol uptake facilitator protein